MYLWLYRNTELARAVDVIKARQCSHSISRCPKLPLVFSQLDRNTVHVFYLQSNSSQVPMVRIWSSLVFGSYIIA